MSQIGAWAAALFCATLVLNSGVVTSEIIDDNGTPQVKLTETAGLSGTMKSSRGGRDYASFKGIPFATVAERFAPSELITEPTWENFRDAAEYGNMCPQVGLANAEQVYGDEDCLNLNVYVPMAPVENAGSLPVMVFVHGGGFGIANGRHGASYFMDEDIIFVTINYRLGAFGFLSTGDATVPGNNGLKDQVNALKWVKANIQKFGGNPDLVTVFGESAGGASTHYLMLSATTKGLIHRAISQSGDALSLWAFEPNPRPNAVALATHLKCPTAAEAPEKISSDEILDCLKKVPAEELTIAQFTFKQNFFPGTFGGIFNFVPVAEPKTSAAPFLKESPWTLLENKKKAIQQIPWMIGMTETEGAGLMGQQVMLNPDLLMRMNTNWIGEASAALLLDRFIPQSAQRGVAVKLKKFYLQNQRISPESRSSFFDVYSDAWGLYGARKAALDTAARGAKNPVYLYLYTYAAQDDSFATFFQLTKEDKIVTHGADSVHQGPNEGMFPGIDFPIQENPEDTEFSKNHIRLWTSFAIHGKPEHSWGNASDQKWKPISKQEYTGKAAPKWYQINENPAPIKEQFTKRMKLWESLKPEIMAAFKKTKKLQKTEL